MDALPEPKALLDRRVVRNHSSSLVTFIFWTLQQKLAPLCAKRRSGFLGCVQNRVKQGRCLCELPGRGPQGLTPGRQVNTGLVRELSLVPTQPRSPGLGNHECAE